MGSFFTLTLGFRPSRPFIFIGEDYKAVFEEDDPTSLRFKLESREKITVHAVSGNINHDEFMKKLAQSRLSVGKDQKSEDEETATEDDFKARMEYQRRRYWQLKREGKLTPEWKAWGRKHVA